MSRQVRVWDKVQFNLGPTEKIAFQVNSSGNVEIKDASGNIIGTLDAANRKLTFPSGAVLDASAATGSISFAAGEVDSADLATNAVTTIKITDANITFAKAKAFASAEQTGSGAAQSIAHGLGVTPTAVLIVPTDTAPATVGAYTAVEGTHTSTNVVVTVTSGKKYKVLAWA